MNRWKTAFFVLAGALVFILVIIIYLATKPAPDVPLPVVEEEAAGGVLVVQTTTKEFEAIAKKYLGDALKDSPFPVDLSIDEDIRIDSEIAVFYTHIPITLHFEPIIDDNGNIRLKQTKMNVGLLNIPPETTLKLMNDSIDFPSWVVVRPNDSEIFIDLSRLNIASGSRVRAKELDLPNNRILLEIIVPTDK